jgi:hypothetical protein
MIKLKIHVFLIFFFCSARDGAQGLILLGNLSTTELFSQPFLSTLSHHIQHKVKWEDSELSNILSFPICKIKTYIYGFSPLVSIKRSFS